MNQLKAGFGRVNINPPMGIPIGGYFVPRHAERILDDIEINALALEVDGKQVVLLSMDQCGMVTPIVTEYRQHISEVTGLALENVFLSATHSHTTPAMDKNSKNPLQQEYYQFIRRRMGDAAQFALDDLKPARMGWATGTSLDCTHGRRYRMKDGSIRTNPGIGNPDILEHTTYPDERVNVLRFDREGGETLVLVNYGNHPDSIGGNNISADWPGQVRRSLEKAIDDTKCIFFNATEGDIGNNNALDTNPGKRNGMEKQFDDVWRGYTHAQAMGRNIAGAALQVYDKVNYVDVDRLATLHKIVQAPSNMPKPEDMEQARKYYDLHKNGHDDQIPYTGMMLTTVVAEACRMVSLEHGPEFFDIPVSGLAIGPVALIGLAGEPFDGVGRALKLAEGWDLVLPCCQTNGREGYFPMQQTYAEGGYESRSSYYKEGVAELLIDNGLDILNTLRDMK